MRAHDRMLDGRKLVRRRHVAEPGLLSVVVYRAELGAEPLQRRRHVIEDRLGVRKRRVTTEWRNVDRTKNRPQRRRGPVRRVGVKDRLIPFRLGRVEVRAQQSDLGISLDVRLEGMYFQGPETSPQPN